MLTVAQAAKKWGLSERRVRVLCSTGRIGGAYQQGRGWLIPDEAVKPEDARRKSAASLRDVVKEKKRRLDACRPLTAGEVERLREQFAVEYTYNTNAIEGNTLTLQETALALQGITVGNRPLKDHLEAVGHKEALDYVYELVGERVPLDKRIIREIHQLVLADKPQDRGVFRSIPVKIMGALHEPVEPALIEPELDRLLAWYEADEGPMVARIARFHVEFEAIHPFIDGNGRTGRLLANLELMKVGYPPIDVKYADRRQYYDAFDGYHSGKKPDAMEKLFLRYLNERLTHYLGILESEDQS